ncbi:hypothetical protein STCU_10405 [Strigomonas culicis]|uniref:Uncharacterized protein n=1 Tax=Strigomonas culicis TaxID=28005 RepID=S9TI74_9TRYP|nr:hypothetical protein STCU_10405 [Strigomonas culicis]|eukprot:EPY17782.1 hypothetical protein STCU_10405 [Strigomonas culicis]
MLLANREVVKRYGGRLRAGGGDLPDGPVGSVQQLIQGERRRSAARWQQARYTSTALRRGGGTAADEAFSFLEAAHYAPADPLSGERGAAEGNAEEAADPASPLLHKQVTKDNRVYAWDMGVHTLTVVVQKEYVNASHLQFRSEEDTKTQ